MERFLIERYWPGVTLDDVGLLNGRLDESSDTDVTFVGSLLVPADEVVLLEFLAIDVLAVLEVSRRVELRCDRVVSVTRVASQHSRGTGAGSGGG